MDYMLFDNTIKALLGKIRESTRFWVGFTENICSLTKPYTYIYIMLNMNIKLQTNIINNHYNNNNCLYLHFVPLKKQRIKLESLF